MVAQDVNELLKDSGFVSKVDELVARYLDARSETR